LNHKKAMKRYPPLIRVDNLPSNSALKAIN
jgi:hypothetical protein